MIIYVLQCVALCSIVLQCVAVCCSMLQCVAVCHSVSQFVAAYCTRSQKTDEAHDSERAHKLQHIVAHYNTLQHTAKPPQHHRNIADATIGEDRRGALPETRTSAATHRRTLQHTATHCNALQQHVATPLQQTRCNECIPKSRIPHHSTSCKHLASITRRAVRHDNHHDDAQLASITRLHHDVSS